MFGPQLVSAPFLRVWVRELPGELSLGLCPSGCLANWSQARAQGMFSEHQKQSHLCLESFWLGVCSQLLPQWLFWLDHSRVWLLTHPAPQDRGSEVPKETHGLVSLPSRLAQSINQLLCRIRPSNSQAAARGQTEQGFPDPVCFLL